MSTHNVRFCGEIRKKSQYFCLKMAYLDLWVYIFMCAKVMYIFT